MIEKFTKRDASAYFNILERVVIWLIGQYYDFVSAIGLFDSEANKYNIGRGFWYVCGVIIVALLFLPFYVAAVIYIVNTLKRGLL